MYKFRKEIKNNYITTEPFQNLLYILYLIYRDIDKSMEKSYVISLMESTSNKKRDLGKAKTNFNFILNNC